MAKHESPRAPNCNCKLGANKCSMESLLIIGAAAGRFTRI